MALIPQAELGGDSEDMSGHRAIYTMPVSACDDRCPPQGIWRVPDVSLPWRIDSYLAREARLGLLNWLEVGPRFAHLRQVGLLEGNFTPLVETVWEPRAARHTINS